MIWFYVGDDDFDDANLHEEQQPHGPVPPSPTHLQTENTCEKNNLGFEKKENHTLAILLSIFWGKWKNLK